MNLNIHLLRKGAKAFSLIFVWLHTHKMHGKKKSHGMNIYFYIHLIHTNTHNIFTF